MWIHSAWRAYWAVVRIETSTQCAGIAFFSFLSFFPVLILFASLLGLFAEESTLKSMVGSIHSVAPDSVLQLVSARIDVLFDQSPGALGLGVVGAGLVAVWSASRSMRSLLFALSQVEPGEDRRGAIERLLVSIACTLAGAGLLVVALGAIAISPNIDSTIGQPDVLSPLRWPVLLVVGILVLSCLYRWGPSRHPPRLWDVLPGAFLASLVWAVASFLFSLYAEQLGDFETTFGSVTAPAVLLLWLYCSAVICIWGAHINHKLETPS